MPMPRITEPQAKVDDVREAVARAWPSQSLTECETHVSRVFLVGDRAYKLKKPVVFPFLDAGTPTRRRDLCREEVRLNRRLAPDLYLGVRAIVRTSRGFELAAEDDADGVDFLVEMRRYDEHSTLAARLSRGELDRADVIAVARVLAAFHAGAEQVAAPGPRHVALQRRMLENTHELLSLVDQRDEVDRVLALERFVHAFVVTHAGILQARAQRGLIREGHGDLRAEHVLVDDGVRIVDCLEFDRSLRDLDVADDLAFLLMDLVARGGARFAQILVRAYREAGGDPGDDALLAFYASQRALVRAKVALLRAGQEPPASAAHGHASAAARELVTLATRLVWQARLPLAIVVCGVPASGKSHLGEQLADVSGLALLSSDFTRKHLAGIAPHQRAGEETYDVAFNHQTYSELGRRAAREIARRGGVIVDATFRHRADRDSFATTFAAAAPVLFVECRAPPSILAQRARRRDRDVARVSDASEAVVLRELGSWEPLDEVTANAHITVRTDRRVEDTLDDVVAGLDQRMDRLP